MLHPEYKGHQTSYRPNLKFTVNHSRINTQNSRLTANGYPHGVESMISDLLKIRQCGPGIPVCLQDRCSIRALGAKSVLVDDVSILLLENRRRDPSNTVCQLRMLDRKYDVLRLKHKPPTNVDATDLLVIPVKASIWLRKGGASRYQLILHLKHA